MTTIRKLSKRDQAYLDDGKWSCSDPRSGGAHKMREKGPVKLGAKESEWECHWCGATQTLSRGMESFGVQEAYRMFVAAEKAGYNPETGLLVKRQG
ncbi:MAG: hypothetical protein V3V32_04620 [Dehalococcoidia bacterium]